jgi:hypothetical protein
MVDVPKAWNTCPNQNLHLGGVQISIGWEVHATPFGALRWIELLKPTQGDDKGLLATYIKDFNCMLNVVPLKNEYVRKLIFLLGLRP